MAEIKMAKSTLDMGALPSNSNTVKETVQRPKPQKVVAAATAKKPGVGRKLADAFLGEEIKDVKSYILQDVVVPTIKNTIIDVVCGGVEMLLLGRTSGRRPGTRGYSQPSGSYVSYSGYYNNSNQASQAQKTMNRYGVDELIFRTHQEASDVLAAMFDYMKDYDGMISVADLYEMVGRPSAFTDNSWGWTDLGGASVRRVRDGYLLVLPRVVSLR